MDALRFERRELKYFVPEDRTEDIRRFIRPYVRQDEYAAGLPGGRYTIHNLYLDTPRMDFFQACIDGANDRVKLRVRWYDDAADGPFFLEVKRKIRDVVIKERVLATRDETRTVLDGGVPPAAATLDRGDWRGFLGRVASTGAAPTIRVRYTREPYESVFGEYARLTLDRAICFQDAAGEGLRERPRAWTFADAAWMTNGVEQATIVELKVATGSVPRWMSDLVVEFGLERTGYSKYAASVLQHLDSARRGLDQPRCAVVRG